MEEQNLQLENLRDNLRFIQSAIYDESIIIDNKFLFQYNNDWYRVRMPNQKELSKAEEYRNKTYVEYLQQSGCITEENLKKRLKENDIVDIYALEAEKNKLLDDIKAIQPSLAVKFSDDIEGIEPLKNKISEIEFKLQEIAYQLTMHLSPSLESRIKSAYMDYLTYLCTEKNISKDKWEPVWKDFKNYEEASPMLTQKAVASMTLLFLNRKEF